MSFHFDEICLKRESSWGGSVKIVLGAKGSTGDAFLLKRVAKNFEYGGDQEGALGRKSVRSILLSRRDIQPLIEQLKACRLSPLAIGIDGCDGEVWTLTITSGETRAQFRWWVKPPAGWEPLRAIADLLMRMGDGAEDA